MLLFDILIINANRQKIAIGKKDGDAPKYLRGVNCRAVF